MPSKFDPEVERKLQAEFAALIPDASVREKVYAICANLAKIQLSRAGGSKKTAKKAKSSSANFAAARAKQQTPEYAQWRHERAKKAIAARWAKARAQAEAEAKAKKNQG